MQYKSSYENRSDSNIQHVKRNVHSMVISQPSMAHEEHPGKEWEYGEMGTVE